MYSQEEWLFLAKELNQHEDHSDLAILSVTDSKSVAVHYVAREQSLPKLLAGHKLESIIQEREAQVLKSGALAVPHKTVNGDAVWFFIKSEETVDLDEFKTIFFERVSQLERDLELNLTKEENIVLRKAVELQYRLKEASSFNESCWLLCDYLKVSLGVSQVTLGWVNNHKIKVIASDSGAEVIKNTELSHAYETLMAESYDQETEVILPPFSGSLYTCKAHQKVAKELLSEHIFTFPVMLKQKCLFLVTVEYFPEQLEERQKLLNQILAIIENVSETLEYKKYQEKGLREKSLDWFYQKSKAVLGTKYVALKVIGIAFLLFALIAALIPVEHRIDGDFSLQSREHSIVVSPIDSIVKTKLVSLGDWVEAGQVILKMDNENDLLEYDYTRNKINQHKVQVRKYLAERKLSELNQTRSALEESKIKLSLIENRIAQSVVKAPISGYVVEMYAEKQVNEPVQKGTPLFRIVSNKDFYVLVEVDERDLQYVNEGDEGRIAFKNTPGLKLPIRITHDDNSLIYKEKEVRFVNQAELTGEQLNWFKDGMTGVSKIDAGRRSLLWVMCRKTYLYLRLKLWW